MNPAIEARTVELVARARAHRELAASRLPERRDPSAATSVQRTWTTPGAPMPPQWSAEAAIQWAYYANVIVYRCAQIRAASMAGLPFRAGLDPNRPSDFNPTCRLAQLLGPPPGGPAPKLTARRLWGWTDVQRTVTGRNAWEVELAPRTAEVVALWPLVSSQLKTVASTGGSEWWKEFRYGQPPRDKTLQPDQVVYGWDPAANDFRQAESCLQAARLDVSIAVMLGRYEYGFLRNDARPAAVVVTERFANDEEYASFKANWNDEFGGPENAGKTSFLETDPDKAVKPSEALNVQVLGLSQKDARFIENHRAALEQVAIAMGVPWSLLSASERTFDNASQEAENFWDITMRPKLADYADEINMQLAPRLGREVGWFDLTGVAALQPKRKFVTLADAAALWDRGIIVADEIRDDIGLEPIDGGDQPAAPAAPATVTPLPAAAAAELPEQRAAHHHAHVHGDGTMHSHPHTHAAGVPDHSHFDEVPHAHTHGAAAPARRETPEPERRHVVEPEQRRATTWRLVDSQVRTLERRWERALRRLFTRQQRATLARLEGNRGRQWLDRMEATPTEQRAVEAGEIFDPDHWQTETADEVEALYEAAVTGGVARLSAQLGVSFDVGDAWAQEFIAARSNQLAGQVTDTTYRAIQEALAEGVAEGEGIPDLADRVRHVFDVADSARASTIARTEVISAYNGSTVLGAAQLGADVVVAQEWISTVDSRIRDDHAAANGQAVGIGELFDVGGEQLAYPGDPAGSPANTIQCRCTVGLLTPDDVPRVGDGAERRVSTVVAAAVLARCGHGPLDELALRWALRQEAA